MVQVIKIIGQRLTVLGTNAMRLAVVLFAVNVMNFSMPASAQSSSSMVEICARYDRSNLTGCLLSGVKRSVRGMNSRMTALETGPVCASGRNLPVSIRAFRARLERLDGDLQTMLAEAASIRLRALADVDRLEQELVPLNREVRRYWRSARGSLIDRIENVERRIRQRCPSNDGSGDPLERAEALLEACRFEAARDVIRDLRGGQRNRLFDRLEDARARERRAQIKMQRARDMRRRGSPPGQVRRELREARDISQCQETLDAIEILLDG